jgi:uncharacterized C2H2 Zn-finger protein
MSEATLGNLVYYFKMQYQDLKQGAAEVRKIVSDIDKSFNKGKSQAVDYGKAVSNALERTQNSLRKHKEELQTLQRTSGIVFGAMVLGMRKSTKELVNYQNALAGLRSVAQGTGQDMEATMKAAQDLAADGLMSVTEAATTLKNLLSSGFDLEHSMNLAKHFKDIAAFNRQAALGFGEAVASASEGIRNQNPILVDNIGLSKNLTKIMTEAGYSEQSLADVKKDHNVQMALYNGLMRENIESTGDASKLANQLGGQFSKTSANVTKLYQALGATVEGPLIKFLKIINDTLVKTTSWIERNKDLAGTLALVTTGTAGTILVVTTLALAVEKVITAFRTMMSLKVVAMMFDYASATKAAAAGSTAAASAVNMMNASFMRAAASASAYLAVIYSINMAVQGFGKWKSFLMKPEEIRQIKDLGKAMKVQSDLQEEIDRLQKTKVRPKDKEMYDARIEQLMRKKDIADQVVLKLQSANAPKMPIQCYQCGKTFKTSAELDKHIKSAHPIKAPGDKKVKEDKRTPSDVSDSLNKQLTQNRHELELQGEAFDKTSADAEAYKNAILDMYEVDPKNIKIAEWTAEFKKLSDQIEKGKNAKEVTEILDELQKSLKSADEQATIFGDQEASLSGKADALKTAITELLSKGIDPTNTKMGNLVQQYKDAQTAVEKYNKAIENQQNAENLLNEGNRRLAEMTGPAIPEWESFAKSLEDAAKADGVLAETSKKLNEIAKSIREAGQAAADSELADRLREIGLEAAQTEIDQQIASLENQRDLISLGTDEVAIRNQSLEIERQIVALEKEKIDLEIADLETQRQKALETKNQAEAKRLEIEIMKLRNDKTNLNTQLYIDEQRPMAEFTKEFQGEFSNAVQEALEGGGKKGFEGLLDYIKKKGTQKIADLITNWIFGNQQGQGFLSNLASAFGVQGAGNQNGGSNMVNLGNGQGVQRMNMPAEGSPMTNNMQMGAGSGFGQNAMGAMAGMAMGSRGGKVGVGATVGSMIGMIWGPIGSMVGGMLGGMVDGLFGDNGSQSMTIKANAASINADFATANFKQVTLPASYFGRSPSNNATSPVTTISVTNNIRGSVITEKDLQKTITETAGQVIAKAQSDSNKWQPVVIQGG